ncbi:flagellar biosynthesis anti-sigma factor FlgM [Spectribacter hydrogenoxidans]|uniref:Negative regulator of flagellin synthesis n=1 Tax=Spectribacter hydrogenoxidans TaxID=3075608 RepID=A0ABU3BVT7_9GAMM|nr:flagellar biosynthesis anti-sigma factor FlgM [Salinisphaera sp. W335]MDT0633407.1 flagellar biosynthesis anti-sigma factor FlgM [Salinisphaera sp. W335]
MTLATDTRHKQAGMETTLSHRIDNPGPAPGVTGNRLRTSQASAEASGSNRPDSVPATDSVRLTCDAQQLQSLADNLKTGDDVDTAKVARLREAVLSGDYSINPARIADRLLAFETTINRA